MKNPFARQKLKSFQLWEILKRDSHVGGKLGADLGLPSFTSGKNFAAEVLGRCKSKNVADDGLATIFRDESAAFTQLADVVSITPDGLVKHAEAMRQFAGRQFSNPEKLPALMGLLEVALEKFGAPSLGAFPRTIVSEQHKNIIRDVQPPYDAFLADELRHIYNDSVETMGVGLNRHDIDIWGIDSTYRGRKLTAIARTPELEAGLARGASAMSACHFVAAPRVKGEEGGLRGLAIRGYMTGRDVRSMVGALRETGEMAQWQIESRAAAYVGSSFGSQLGGHRGGVPREVARVHTALHDVLRPFLSKKYEAAYYADMPDGRMPTLREAIVSAKEEKRRQKAAGGKAVPPSRGNPSAGRRAPGSGAMPPRPGHSSPGGARPVRPSSSEDASLDELNSFNAGAGPDEYGEEEDVSGYERDADGNVIYGAPPERSAPSETTESASKEREAPEAVRPVEELNEDVVEAPSVATTRRADGNRQAGPSVARFAVDDELESNESPEVPEAVRPVEELAVEPVEAPITELSGKGAPATIPEDGGVGGQQPDWF